MKPTHSTPGIVPYLYHEDTGRMLQWLPDAFGLRVRTDETFRDPGGRVVHAALDAPYGSVMIGSPGTDYRNPLHLGQPTQNLYVYVDDLEAHFERAQAAGATIVGPVESTFYGDRRYGAEDPEGHVWYFAVKDKDVPAHDWQPSESDLSGH